MNTRRFLPRLLLCLALGALTTIVIAWSLAPLALPPAYSRLSLHIDPDDLTSISLLFGGSSALGRARYEWAPIVAPTTPIATAPLISCARAMANDVDAQPPDESPLLLLDIRPDTWPSIAAVPETLTSAQGRSTDLRGLPFPALSSSVPVFASFRTGLGPPVSWGIAIRKPTSDMQDPWSALPLRPVFPGFLLDTLIWSLPWLAARTLIPMTRRAQRRRRNQCPNCAYSRANLDPQAPCPECGHATPPPAPTEPRP